ncbi:hypothetical protein X953_16120 [Virgibacillus sp. SK37]|nr:hypothetical protein X953_16120 [Virgibacillus sp. SK37]
MANGRILRKYTDTAGEVQFQFVEEIPESREQNAFMKTMDTFGEIGQDVWDAAGQRADKMTDSWYDFGNYITFGAVEGIYEGYMHRADKMFDSTYDLFNAFSFGTADMIQGAINPEENFSKEHWLNSIGLAGMVVGARVPAGRAGSGTKATVNKVEGATKTPNATPKPKPDAGKMTIPTIQTLTGKLNWFKAHLPELRVVQDSTGGQHYVFSKRGDGNGNLREYKNYKSVEYNGNTKVNGKVRNTSRRVYQRKDIDYERVDPKTGKNNYQLMKSGKPPIWKDGTKIELHHLIQREPGSMVELPSSMHKEYDRILHGLVENGGSFRNDPVLKKQYENFRTKYWRWRAKEIDIGENYKGDF